MTNKTPKSSEWFHNLQLAGARIRAKDEILERQRAASEPDPRNYLGVDLSEAVFNIKNAMHKRDLIDDLSNDEISADTALQIDKTTETLHNAGKQVYAALGSTNAMIAFAKTYVRRDRLRDVDHSWDGIGDWVA